MSYLLKALNILTILQTHHLHRTYLYFYQAVCYESLGHIAHDYSGNKVPLLEQARDAFISANDLLPLPFLTSSDGLYEAPPLSPTCSILSAKDPFQDESQGSNSLLSGPDVVECDHGFAATPLRPKSTDQVLTPYSGPKFENYSPRQPLGQQTSGEANIKVEVRTQQHEPSNHKARLSRSLSSQHALAEHLVPSPLFTQDLSCERESRCQLASSTDTLPLAILNKPLPTTPVNRPLPRLPFYQNLKFVSKGERLVIVPRRKTALTTLTAKFENRPVSALYSPTQPTDQENYSVENTPTTQRFDYISTTFLEKENKENIPPSCLTLKHNSYEVKIGLPTHLELYNDFLASFRTSLLRHISAVTARIIQVRNTQLAHEADKRRSFAKMHSSASAIPVASSPTKSYPRGRCKNRDSQPMPANDSRLRSFWSLQAADIGTRYDKSKDRKGSTLTWAEEEKARKRRDRIEKLRSGGWKDIRKEAKGWKGADHYEALRKAVEQELSVHENSTEM